MSYYRQSGVIDGLIRSINQGLSARVKSDDAYANTRLNNCEFKRAAAIVKPVYAAVTPAWRTMFRRFAFAELVKTILASIKEDDGTWGCRIPAADLPNLMVDAFENHAKSGTYDGLYGDFSASANDTDMDIAESISVEKQTELQALGIDGVFVKPVGVAVAVKAPAATNPELPGVLAIREKSERLTDLAFTGTAISNTDNIAVLDNDFIDTTAQARFTAADETAVVAIIGIMPYRTVNGQKYILQERCTYVTKALPYSAFGA